MERLFRNGFSPMDIHGVGRVEDLLVKAVSRRLSRQSGLAGLLSKNELPPL